MRLNILALAAVMAAFTVGGYQSQAGSLNSGQLRVRQPQESVSAQQTAVWRAFSPSTGEFAVSMPSPVESTALDIKNYNATRFWAKDGRNFYTIMVPTVRQNALRAFICAEHTDDKYVFEQSSAGFLEGLKKSGLELISSLSVSGKGWTGDLCKLSYKGHEASSALVVRANGTQTCYFLTANAPSGSEEVKRFFESFAVDPSKAAEAHRADAQPWGWPSAYEWGTIAGYWGTWLLIVWGLWKWFGKRLSKAVLSRFIKMER